MISNGTRNQGYFYNTHHEDSINWEAMSFNSEQSPIVDSKYVSRIVDLYGRESDEFKIRVAGGFPASEQMDEKGWIPLINNSQIAQVSDGLPFIGKKKLGIDPSGEGDDLTVWVMRDRFMARVIHKEQTSSDKGIAKKTYEIIKEYGLEPSDCVIGAFGAGMNTRAELLKLDHTMDIIAINEGMDAEDSSVYVNKRAVMD